MAKSLKAKNMVIDENTFNKFTKKDEEPYNIANVPDFNSLILVSQQYNKPIFELTQAELGQAGAVLEQQQNNQQLFKEIFSELANKICGMIGLKNKEEKN